jgi:hypothetical protein
MLKKLGFDRGFFIYGGVLSVIAALVYLPLSSTFGLYRDDWYLIWAGRTQYLSAIVDMFSIDRPAMGYLYTRTYLLLGDDPANWVFFSFAVRLAGVWGFLALLRVIWTEKRFMGFVASLLFLIYPGFLQMPNAITFNNHVITLTLIVFSILLTVISLKIGNRWLGVGALALQAAYHPIYEYMIGLEGMRLALIWYVSNSAADLLRRIRVVILRCLPYALVVAGFMYWRIFLFKSNRPTTDIGRLASTYAADPFTAIG